MLRAWNEVVCIRPALHALAVGDAIDGDPGNRSMLAIGGNALELALECTARCPACGWSASWIKIALINFHGHFDRTLLWRHSPSAILADDRSVNS